MTRKSKKKKASELLIRRYVAEDGDRRASLETERVNAGIARMIYDLRDEAGLTQKQLADLIDTKQSVISRLESSDYDGHSLSMLDRIAKALNRKLKVDMPLPDEQLRSRIVFCQLMRQLRARKELSVEELASRADIAVDEVRFLEQSPSYKPSPRSLYQLAAFYKISHRNLAVLAGAIKDKSVMSPAAQQQVSRFAAQSDSFAKLSQEEKQTLDAVVSALREGE